MVINPYLKELLEKWGRVNRRDKPWYRECPYMQEHIGKTTRTPVICSETDEIELLGLRITDMAKPLRRALEARFKHKFKSDVMRAKWCRCTKEGYYVYLNRAIQSLENWLTESV